MCLNVPGFPDTENSGFILDLTGELPDYKNDLNAHLENGWLDGKTRSLVIEFQTHSPNTDSTTLFKIKFETISGLMFTINKVVWFIKSKFYTIIVL